MKETKVMDEVNSVWLHSESVLESVEKVSSGEEELVLNKRKKVRESVIKGISNCISGSPTNISDLIFWF